jgi:hypothetical protein
VVVVRGSDLVLFLHKTPMRQNGDKSCKSTSDKGDGKAMTTVQEVSIVSDSLTHSATIP